MRRCRPREIFFELLDLAGKRVVDVGCGETDLAHRMAERGAVAFGIDTKEDAIARVQAAQPAGGATYRVGRAERMPFDDASLDIVIFTNSLHHVAPELMAAAMDEAWRVLAPGGVLMVADPLAAGPRYELTRLIDDEAEVRKAAWAAVDGALQRGFTLERELEFIHERTFDGYEDFRRKVCRNDKRTRAFAANEAEIRRNYHTLGTPRDGGKVFDQPIRVKLMRKRARAAAA